MKQSTPTEKPQKPAVSALNLRKAGMIYSEQLKEWVYPEDQRLNSVRDEPQPASNHTPEPWKIEEGYPTYNQGHFQITGANGKTVCEPHVMYDGSGRRDKYPDGVITPPKEAKANAELIVQAVNERPVLLRSNGELLEACQMILDGWESSQIPTLTPEQRQTLSTAIRNASEVK